MSTDATDIIDALLATLDGAVLVCRSSGHILQHDTVAKTWFGPLAEDAMVQDLFTHGEVMDWFGDALPDGPVEDDAETSAPSASGMALTTTGRWVRARVRPSGDAVVVHLQPEDGWTEGASVPHEVLRDLIETMREPLASVRAAAETMALYPQMDALARSQFMEIIEEQTDALSRRLDAAVVAYADLYRAAGPLHSVDAAAFVQALAEQLTATLDITVSADSSDRPAAGGLLLMVDPQAMTEAVRFLVQRIENAARCTELRLAAHPVRSVVAMDLIWSGGGVTASRLQEWQQTPLTWGDSIVKMTLADILDHHDAQMIGPAGTTGKDQPEQKDTDPHNTIRLLLPAADGR